jgi:nicotinamide phosphoribosyltransferase
MYTIDPIIQTDFYKIHHKFQYHPKTEMIYSNFTPRSNRLAPVYGSNRKIRKVVNFGLQGFIKNFLIGIFNKNFFQQDIAVIKAKYARLCGVDTTHIEELHALGYLPIKIKALPEGELIPMKVPMFTVKSTLPKFYWLVNYLETVMSDEIWKPTTVATIAFEYRKLLEHYATKTGSPLDFVKWQGHDFSMRGMSGMVDAAASGSGHLLPFTGTDTIPAIDYLEQLYGGLNTFVGASVPASEHSTASANILFNARQIKGETDTEEVMYEAERAFLKRYITEIYPTGVASYVSDTFDFFRVINEIAPSLKKEIMSRQPDALGLNKVVFRPDSGDPVEILCGQDVTDENIERTPEQKGAVEVLWDHFGGTITETGHKLLDCHVGLIYGDSITLSRAEEILRKLEQKGFASGNVVFGIGSFTYQYLTRDTFGFAMKATYQVVDGEGIELFKDPVTDSGTKKSARGLLLVTKDDLGYNLIDQVDGATEEIGCLRTVFKDGVLTVDDDLATIRTRVEQNLIQELQDY